ncbi:hypothetical protein QBC43DRAFT_303908 [Cladorrhinum sp. PSN259]|nr:hypothetical protein QBC43DRAFT_303908 [Cladorrhinum sp. PSN259]
MALSNKSPGPDPTLHINDFFLFVQPLLRSDGKPLGLPTDDDKKLSTLNYQCVAQGNPLPDQPGTHQPPLALPTSHPTVKVEYIEQGILGVDSYTLFSADMTPGSYPAPSNITFPVPTSENDNTVLQYTRGDAAEDSANGGHLKVETYYEMNVKFRRYNVSNASKIIVQQKLYVNLYVKNEGTSKEGKIVSKIHTDTYSLAIDNNSRGKLVLGFDSSQLDTGKEAIDNVSGFLNWWTGVNNIIQGVTKNDFVFPGGRELLMEEVGFSDARDLVPYISYAEPA